MAKFVLAGMAGCSSYARAEMLADTLAARLPNFNVNKVVQSESDWPSWLSVTCKERNWSHNGSPLVWRELVDTGGKGLYLGGLKAFEEYSEHYYGVIPTTTPELEAAIAAENEATLAEQRETEREAPTRAIFRVCVTNATCSLAYQVLYQLATGGLLGPSRLALHLYQHEGGKDSECRDISLALQDLAAPSLDYVKICNSLHEAMADVDLVLLLDWNYCSANIKACSSEHAQWSDVMVVIGNRYRDYARCIKVNARPDVRVCVTGCMANVGVAVMVACEPMLSQCCIAAPSLAETQAKTVLSHRLKVHHKEISKVIIWGHTHNQVLADNSFIRVEHFPGAVVEPHPFDLPLTRCEFDKKWLNEEFPMLVLNRHQHSCHGDGPALAEAVSLIQLMRKWMLSEEWQKEEGEEEETTAEEATEEETTGGEETAEETTGEETTGEETTGEETTGEETAGEETAGEDGEDRDSREVSKASDSKAETKSEDEREQSKETEQSKEREQSGEREQSEEKNDRQEHEISAPDVSGSRGGRGKRVSIEVKISEADMSKSSQHGDGEATSKGGVVENEVPPSASESSDRQPTARTEETRDTDTQAEDDDMIHTGVWHSVGVVSDGGEDWHGIPAGIVACVPCQCKEGVWKPILNVPVRKHLQEKFKAQINTLQQELQVAMATLK